MAKRSECECERGGSFPINGNGFSRRQFLTQVGGTGLVLGGAAAAGLLVQDRWGMEGIKPPPPVRLKDYSVALPPSRPNLIVVRSTPPKPEDYATREEELDQLVDAARHDQPTKVTRRKKR